MDAVFLCLFFSVSDSKIRVPDFFQYPYLVSLCYFIVICLVIEGKTPGYLQIQFSVFVISPIPSLSVFSAEQYLITVPSFM